VFDLNESMHKLVSVFFAVGFLRIISVKIDLVVDMGLPLISLKFYLRVRQNIL
jgi:hypothetical protein